MRASHGVRMRPHGLTAYSGLFNGSERGLNDFMKTRLCLLVLSFAWGMIHVPELHSQNEPPPFNPQGQPNRNRPGPWNNDVLVYRTGAGTKAEKLATFPRAGVPTVARLKDGRLAAAHQHFPADNDADFDKVALHFSTDEGRTWTDAQVIRVSGLPEGMRFPFDPTLVPLADGRVRLYFTSLKGRQFSEDRPAIYSAISSNALDYVFEPGARFGVEGRPVIDCAVALHQGVFHLFAPDNGAGNNPGVAPRDPADRARAGVSYHATSRDGLNFTRQPDVRLDGARRWLGNAQSDGDGIRFFGTGGPGGVWTATSTNGSSWTVDESFPSVMGADPGAVKLQDGGWLLAVTGPPRDGRGQAGPMGQGHGQPFSTDQVLSALDANGDGAIDEWEIQNAAALLRKLDRNGDGRLTPEELRSAPNQPRDANESPARRPRQPAVE